jgi:hypothetical protein
MTGKMPVPLFQQAVKPSRTCVTEDHLKLAKRPPEVHLSAKPIPLPRQANPSLPDDQRHQFLPQKSRAARTW